MKIIYFYVAIITFFLTSLNGDNLLQFETSPYLLQHKKNPVKWMPWGKKAFDKAEKEHKKIFLSIGYSTCHWCHVMEKESFEDQEIAKLLNKDFISIKIDKEEMPHIDSYFQEMYRKIKGKNGGWPLNVFIDKDKNIYFISTYIPKENKSYAEGLQTLLPKIVKTHKYLKLRSQKQQEYKLLTMQIIEQSLLEEFDICYKGFGRSKKFPHVSKLQLMFDLALLNNNKIFYKNVVDTLDMMALRGLYDHVDGGFYRYSVDAAWEIPHFEKMLYVQAELVSLYTRVYLQNKKQLYKDVIDETITMLEKRFAKNQLYWSASDADSNHIEGYYFTFTPKEIAMALQYNKYKKSLEDALEFSIDGNFEERVHLNFYTYQRPKGFKQLREELQVIRQRKIYPFIDKKINTAWNAMMIASLYKAGTIENQYAVLAEEHLKALKKMMFIQGELYHQGVVPYKVEQKAFLEDYAYFIDALIYGYEYDYSKEKLDFAEYLINQALFKFYNNGVWYLSQDSFKVEASIQDKYYRSGVAKIIENLLRLAYLGGKFKYEEIARKSLHYLHKNLLNTKVDTSGLVRDYIIYKYGFATIKSSKINLKKNLLKISQLTYPFILRKRENFNDYLLCTLRRCFYKDGKFKNIDKIINENLRKYH